MADLYDLISVGGGLAGSALARSMAEHGARVLVLERERKFKDRVRGEFIEPWGVAEARMLGIDGLLREQVAHELYWFDLRAGNLLTLHRDMVSTTPHQLPCVAFYHPEMQELLIDSAERAGAEVRRGPSVHEVRSGALSSVVFDDGGHIEEMRARLVVGADGRSSTVRQSCVFRVQRDPGGGLIAGVLMENVPAREDTAHMVVNFNPGRIAFLFPQGGGRARAYFCYQRDSLPRLQGEADLPRFVEECKRTGSDAGLYEGAKAAGPLATFDCADTWVEHPYRDGVALVGDAAAASDPTWGQGLALTLRDVRVLRDHLLSTDDWNAAGHAYAAEHDRHYGVIHTVDEWYAKLYLKSGLQADARRARALPLIAEDPMRQPDALFSGPDLPIDEPVRRRFFGED